MEPDPVAEAAYFRAVEAIFLRLRGAPLLLSPADWQAAQRWRALGIPLEVVEEAMEELFARRKARGAKGRVNGLHYCTAAVERGFARRLELSAPEALRRRAPQPLDVEAELARLCEALPETLPARAAWVARITSLSGSPPQVETALAALDSELLGAADASLDDTARTAVDSAVEEALRRHEGRLDPAEKELLRSRLRAEGVRRRCGLPLLTLFGPTTA